MNRVLTWKDKVFNIQIKMMKVYKVIKELLIKLEVIKIQIAK